MILNLKKISHNNRYGYARVSSREQTENSSLESQKAELIKLGVPEENIRVEVGSAADQIQERPVFYHLIDNQLKENKNLSITEIAKVTGRGRTTIYKVLKEELNYVPYNCLVKHN